MCKSPLLHAIYSYRGAWNSYLAASLLNDDAPLAYKPELAILESWDKPAEDWMAAEAALELAVEFYHVGDSDVIPAMMKASLGWMKTDRERRASA